MEDGFDRLLEPSKAYRECYRDLFKKNTEELFDSLVQKSGMDVEKNRKTVKEYRKASEASAQIQNRRAKMRTLQVLLILLCIACWAVCFWGISKANVLMITIPLPCFAVFLVLILRVIKPKIKILNQQLAESDARANTFLSEAEAQIAPLQNLFDSTMTADLIQKTVPTLVIDRQFDMKRYDYLHGKYGLQEQSDRETSTVGVLSGEIIGNPFLFERTLHHTMGMQLYTGSLTIHWVTYSRDANGKTVARHHTQTLHASVRKPKPFFNTFTRLIYGNDAAPDLSFSRQKTHAEQKSERELKSFIKSKSGKIQKKAQKSVPGGFTEMANEKFDALFGAVDRDNEIQFRLLFTPLAQQNLLGLMTGESPFGDDFDFIKSRCLNQVISEHAQNWDLDTDPSKYHSYDVDICKSRFLEFNTSYFASFYFDMAPLLSIPLYQQIKPREYLYKPFYERNYTARETELMANKLGTKVFAHPSSRTPAILKTEFLQKNGDVDLLSVTAYSYRTVHRTDFISVFGGDGKMHMVPVNWVEYIPLSKQSEMQVKSLDLSETDYRNTSFASSKDPHAFFHRLFATIGKEGLMTDASPNDVDDDNVDYGDIVEDTLENIEKLSDSVDETED